MDNTNPPLTTVNIPREDMAHMAVSVLYDRIQRKHKEFVRIELVQDCSARKLL